MEPELYHKSKRRGNYTTAPMECVKGVLKPAHSYYLRFYSQLAGLRPAFLAQLLQ